MKALITIIIAVSLVACSKVDVSRYAGSEPQFDLFGYFSGHTRGWGMVQDRDGFVTRQFTVVINGRTTEDQKLVLDEDFSWRNGEKSQRTWIIEKTGENSFQGEAGDIIGKARGATNGNALNWKYVLNLKVDGTFWKIHLDDWMYLQPDNVLLNKTTMSKFGIHLGEITIVFFKPDTRSET